MTVLITGGTGFIGLALAEALLKRGDSVVLSGLAPPPDWATRMLPGRPAFVAADITDGAALEAAMHRHGVTRLVHGAAITSDAARERHAARQIVDVNIAGTVETLEAALRAGLSKVVQLGTGSVFGGAGLEAERLAEDHPRPLPDSLYAITKYAAERIGLRYRDRRGLNLVVARVGTAFGRWEHRTAMRDTPSLALSMMTEALAGGPIMVPADAGGDWIYSVDVAEGVLHLLDDPCPAPAPLYHLSAGRHWDGRALAEALARQRPGLRVVTAPPRTGSHPAGSARPTSRAPFAVDRLARDYGWRARFDLDAAAADYTAWAEAATPDPV